MAIITVTATYPDAKQLDVRDTLASAFGYTATIDDGQGGTIPNPQSKVQFVQSKLDNRFKAILRSIYREEKDRQTAIALAAANEELEVT